MIHRVFRGAQALYTLRLASGSELLWLAPSHEEYRIGEAPGDHGDLTGWLKTIYALSVDAVFSDFPAAAVNAR